MAEVKTGIYKRITITLPEKELIIQRANLEEKIKELDLIISKKEKEKSDRRGLKENLESLRRIKKTGNLLMRGYLAHEITKELRIKYSTAKRYIEYFIPESNPKT